MLSIVSSDAKFDRVLAGEETFTPSEERGRILFQTEYNPFFPEASGADCAHCHGGSNFENDRYMNNGLDTDAEFTDLGREAVTNNPQDRAKFKVPSLRNVAVTAPYMHDGRFATLREVVEHYNSGGHPSLNKNTLIQPLGLTEYQMDAIVEFLHTLTDTTYLSNPAFQNPFEE